MIQYQGDQSAAPSSIEDDQDRRDEQKPNSIFPNSFLKWNSSVMGSGNFGLGRGLFRKCYCLPGEDDDDYGGSGSGLRNAFYPKTPAVFMSEEAFDDLPESEKNRVYTELYGTDDAMEETEAFLNAKLRQLDMELSTRRMQMMTILSLSSSSAENKQQQHQLMNEIHDNNNDNNISNKKTIMITSYCLALEQEKIQKTNYVRSRKFRLMFLRSERFHVTDAADRMCTFFDMKKELFGVHKLPHPITQDDLNDDDMEALRCGALYLNAGIERTGRMVGVVTANQLRYKHHINIRRAWFYYIMSSIQDHEITQRRGLVLLIYNIVGGAGGGGGLGGGDGRGGSNNNNNNNNNNNMKKDLQYIRSLLYQGLPYRRACYHHCHDNRGGEAIVAYMLSISGIFLKARYQQHYGSHRKVRSQLIQYGFQVHLLPIDPKGQYDYDMLFSAIKKLRKKELFKLRLQQQQQQHDQHNNSNNNNKNNNNMDDDCYCNDSNTTNTTAQCCDFDDHDDYCDNKDSDDDDTSSLGSY